MDIIKKYTLATRVQCRPDMCGSPGICSAEIPYDEFSELLRLAQIGEQTEKTSINALTEKVHENAVKKGWWQKERSFGDIISLCHAELSEALEEYRNGHKPIEVYYNGEKPEGIPIELADVVIRIMDYCGHAGIDLESALLQKIEYNETRPYRHGGKKL